MIALSQGSEDRVTELGCFIPGSRGQLYLACFGNSQSERVLLYLPPFAEEMNLSRTVVAHQARRLAASGWYVVLLDYFGSGDSEGELEDASISLWLEDIRTALDWINRKPRANVTLWGLRFGALLACHYCQHLQPGGLSRQPDHLLLWRPLLSGASYLKQFFRLKLINDRLSGAAAKQDWYASAMAGESVEVAGYWLAPPLVRELSALQLSLPATVPSVDWIEIGAGAFPPAAERIINASTPGVRHQLCAGQAFWQVPGCGAAEPLWLLSDRLLQETADRD